MDMKGNSCLGMGSSGIRSQTSPHQEKSSLGEHGGVILSWPVVRLCMYYVCTYAVCVWSMAVDELCQIAPGDRIDCFGEERVAQ